MWEAIRANRRRSLVIMTAMAAVLLMLGYVIGLAIDPRAGFIGLGIAFAVWFFLFITAQTAGSSILLGSVGAREIEHDDSPVLFNCVEEMTIASGLGKVPKVYIMDNDAPNAFAVGTEKNSAVAVTTGLLMRLNRDELQGVVAHEIGHIKNNDTRFLTHAGVMMAAIIIVSDLFLRMLFYGGMSRGRRRSRSSGGGGGVQVAMVAVALVFAILAPLLAQLLYLACSRRREYLADASSATFTRYPEGLASALSKISARHGKMKVSRGVAPMFIVNPLASLAAGGLLSTHPPTEDRIRVLREMGGGAGFADYEAAFRRRHGGEGVLGARTLREAQNVSAREATADARDDLQRAREAVDILHRTAGYLMFQCACGLKVKIPPSYDKETVECPRCHRTSPVPTAEALGAMAGVAAAAGAMSTTAGQPQTPPTVPTIEHQGGQWTSFRCKCGGTVQLSPSFTAKMASCRQCGRHYPVHLG